VKRDPAEPRLLVTLLDRVLAKALGSLLPRERRYWVLVPATGLGAGLLAVLFFQVLGLLHGASWGDARDVLAGIETTRAAQPWLLVLVPALGGAVVALAALILGKARGSPGTSGIIEALALRKGYLSLSRNLLTAAASITAVGTGASLGREGPVMGSGASLASWLGRNLNLEEHHVKTLVACGAAGGMAASYNAPIAASVFAMEVLIGSFAFELFGPILVSSVISTAVSRALLGDSHPYEMPAAAAAAGGNALLLLAASALLGVLIGLVSVLFIRVFSGVDELFGRFKLRRLDPLKPVLVMAVLGAVGYAYPELFGNGYETVNDVLREPAGFAWQALIVLCALKMIVTALCRAGGVPGGLFTPSLFIGALLGAAFGAFAMPFLDEASASSHATFALLGMGAILAGTLKAPITAVLMVFELTQNYDVILPLMACCLASTFVSHLLQRGSLFTEPLRRKGIVVPAALAPTWLRQPSVAEFVNPKIETVLAAERFESVVDRFLRSPVEHDRLYVVDAGGSYLGVISLHEIKSFIRESANLETVIALDVLNASFPCVSLRDPMSRAIELLAESDAERLPVVADREDRRLVGSVSKRRLLAAYRERNLARAPKEA
jgi:CIC family chloride channel protein